MKIAFVNTVFSHGGASKSTIELANRIKNLAEVKVFDMYGTSEAFISDLNNNNINNEIILKSEKSFIIHKHGIKILNFYRLITFIFKWIYIKKKVKNSIEVFDPDIILVNDLRTLAYFIGYKSPSKIFFFLRRWVISSRVSFFVRYLFKKIVDKIICVSEASRQATFIQGFADLEYIEVLHNAIDKNFNDTQEFCAWNGDRTFQLLHSGGFLPDKGHLVALKALKLLVERKQNVFLTICGIIYPGKGDLSKKYYNKLLSYVDENNLQNYVHFEVDNNDVFNYFKKSDVLLFPSNSEGLPRSVMESMALGKPVVANAVGGITDLIIDNFTGYIAKHNSCTDYANRVEMLMNNPKIYKRISSNSLELIKTCYNEESQINKMTGIICKR